VACVRLWLNKIPKQEKCLLNVDNEIDKVSQAVWNIQKAGKHLSNRVIRGKP
jgi:hypothetical protein